TKRLEQHERRIHGEDGELAMGEIDDAHHAENHREAERHEAVDQAGEDALDDDIQGDRRHSSPAPRRRTRLHLYGKSCRNPAGSVDDPSKSLTSPRILVSQKMRPQPASRTSSARHPLPQGERESAYMAPLNK